MESQVLDLTPYINTSVVKVDENFSLERAYVVLRTLGLRHLIIVDVGNHVRGIVTRKVRPLPGLQQLHNALETGPFLRTGAYFNGPCRLRHPHFTLLASKAESCTDKAKFTLSAALCFTQTLTAHTGFSHCRNWLF